MELICLAQKSKKFTGVVAPLAASFKLMKLLKVLLLL